MGACVSSQKDQEAVMKFNMSFGSKTDHIVVPPSPVKDKPLTNGDPPIGETAIIKSQPNGFLDFGMCGSCFLVAFFDYYYSTNDTAISLLF